MTESSPPHALPRPGCGLRTACGAAFLAIVAGGGSLPAADDVVVDQVSAAPSALAVGAAAGPQMFLVMGNNRLNRLRLPDRGGLPEVPGVAAPTVELGSLFDRIAFGPEAGGNRSGDEIVAGLQGLGEKRIELLGDVCGLAAEQRRSLRLLLASDLAEFAADLAARRIRYAGVEMSVRPGALDRDLVVELRTDATACRFRWQRFFGPTSLLASAIPQVLEPQQHETLATWVATRREKRWRAMLAAVLLKDVTGGRWRSPEAATAAVRLLAEDVPPLAVFAAACDPSLDARMTKLQHSLVMVRLGRVPEHALRPLVSPTAWAGLRHDIDRAEEPGVGQLERQLILRQVLEEEEP